jgi:hypothetical protein
MAAEPICVSIRYTPTLSCPNGKTRFPGLWETCYAAI